MNENINLCEILKGHEGEIFYCPFYGNVKLRFVVQDNSGAGFQSVVCETSVFSVNRYGFLKFTDDIFNQECVVFPSKDQRDWNKWLEEQKSKVPKTWSELVKHIQPILYAEISHKSDGHYTSVSEDCGNTPIEKSALALLKINQLIEVGYGGNITNEEWVAQGCRKWVIVSDSNDGNFIVVTTRDSYMRKNPAFHTEEQAEEFLSKPENVKLLKDYFQIN